VEFLQSQAFAYHERGGIVTSWLAFPWSYHLLIGPQHLSGLTWDVMVGSSHLAQVPGIAVLLYFEGDNPLRKNPESFKAVCVLL